MSEAVIASQEHAATTGDAGVEGAEGADWGVDASADLERARSLIIPATDSLEHRIVLGKILYSLRLRGMSQKRQSSELGLPRSRVAMLQRIGSFHA